MLKSEKELLLFIGGKANRAKEFAPSIITEETVTDFRALQDAGCVEKVNPSIFRVTRQGAALLEMLQELDEQSAQNAAKERRAKIGQILTALASAILGSVVTVIAERLSH